MQEKKNENGAMFEPRCLFGGFSKIKSNLTWMKCVNTQFICIIHL